MGESAADGKAWASAARSKKNMPRPLQEVLSVLQEEAQEGLPVGYITMDTIAKHAGKGAVPSRDKLLEALRAAGFVASRCAVHEITHLHKAYQLHTCCPGCSTHAECLCERVL